MKDSFLTISSPSESLYTEKGSKFFGYAFPLKKEEEIKFYINILKKKHHKARHFCYAFMLGSKREHYRSSDAGEPSGTAGPPILGQINSKNLTNILLVSVRYFGGTKLGVSGLINAYRTNAKETIETAQITEKTIENQYAVHFTYPLMSDVMRLLKNDVITIEKQVFEEKCMLYFSVRLSLADEIINKLQALPIISCKQL